MTIRPPIATAAALIAVLPTAVTATITGSPITVHASDNDWTVNDARGNSTGWNVTVQASQFTTGGGTPHTLATGSLSLTTPSAVAAGHGLNTSTAPTIIAGPFTIDNGSAVKIVTAPNGLALGQWDFTQSNASGGDLAVSVPPDAWAGTYTTTVTFTLGNTP